MNLSYASFFLIPSGRLQEAVTLMEKTVALDPLNVPLRSSFAICLMSAEMYDRAIEEARKGLEIDDRLWLPYVSLVWAYVMKGMIPEALVAAEKAYQMAAWHPRIIGTLAGLLVRAGERSRAENLIAQLRDNPDRLMGPGGMVLYHLICSEVDAAADWFEKAVEQRDPLLLSWLHHPFTKPLRESPRWPKIARMMNLPDTMSQVS
jgi:tetratricopeptide (TPR) repeat protein